MNTLHTIAFTVYPYVCLAFFLMGSLVTSTATSTSWKSDSSQLLRRRQLRWGQQPVPRRDPVPVLWAPVRPADPARGVRPGQRASSQKQLLAVIAGGVAGGVGFIGLTMLLHRRLFDPRIRLTSHRTDIAILVILWCNWPSDCRRCPCRCTMHRTHHHDAPGRLPAGASCCCSPMRRSKAWNGLPASHVAGHDDLPAVPLQPPRSCGAASVPLPTCSAVSDGAFAPAQCPARQNLPRCAG